MYLFLNVYSLTHYYCTVTGRCSFSQLRTFTTTATGIQTTGQSSLMQLPNEPDSVLYGSFIVFTCISGYVNTGGSLNITCGGNGAWSQLPNCVMSSGGGSLTTTTMTSGGGSTTTTTKMPSGGGGVPCMIDPASTFIITNGYATNMGLSYVSNTAATGNQFILNIPGQFFLDNIVGSIQFACTPGYVL